MNHIKAVSVKSMFREERDMTIAHFRKRETEARAHAASDKPEDTVELSNLSDSGNDSHTAIGKRKWTVLCYMDGHNDLEYHAACGMLDLEHVGSDDRVAVVAELGRLSQQKLMEAGENAGRPYEPSNIDGDWSGVRRYFVRRDDPADPDAVMKINSPVVSDLGDVDMSSPKTLSDFITWGMKNYPAEHYLLVMMDHGGGWQGAFSDSAAADGEHIMMTPQISEALKDAEKATGKKPDVIDMMACLMGSGEVAYELRDRAQFYVASEELGDSSSFIDYSPLIDSLKKDASAGHEVSPLDLARRIVNYYTDKPGEFVTKSAVDLSKMDGLRDAINDFAYALKHTKTRSGAITESIDKAQGFSNPYHIDFYTQVKDLYGIAHNVAENSSINDRKLKQAASSVMEAVDGSVVANVSGTCPREILEEKEYPGSREKYALVRTDNKRIDGHGISIFAPLNKEDALISAPYYSELSLSRDNCWDEFILSHNS